MKALQALLDGVMGLSFLGLAVALCHLAHAAGGQQFSVLWLGLGLLGVLFVSSNLHRHLGDRLRAEEGETLQKALRAYSEIRAEVLNLCAGVTVSLSLCCHYCFSDPRRIYAEINRLWGAVDEFQQIRLARLDDRLLGPATPAPAGPTVRPRP